MQSTPITATSIEITQPSDFHLHFREADLLNLVTSHVTRDLHYALAMPNLKTPVATLKQALAYRSEIMELAGAFLKTDRLEQFYPLMTLYLQETTPASLVKEVAVTKEVLGFKWYPQGATTFSSQGVNKVENIFAILAEMETQKVPLLIHGEQLVDKNGKDIDVFDREKYFIDDTLVPVLKRYPNLKVTLEHITTKEAVQFVESAPDTVAATVTSHHLYLNRNDLLADGIKPHYYCKPIVKRSHHQEALIEIVTSGHRRFFMGSDSAPHLKKDKESACGCAGLYTAPHNLALYAEVFYQANALGHLERFVSLNGCEHYGLPIPSGKRVLNRLNEGDMVPTHYGMHGKALKEESKDKVGVVPFKAGEPVFWKVNLV